MSLPTDRNKASEFGIVTQPQSALPNFFALGMLVQLVALILAVAGLYFAGIEVLWSRNTLPDLALGTLGAVLSWIGALRLTRSNTSVGATLRNHCRTLHGLFRHSSSAQLVLLALAAGVCEELLFRGFLQSWLARHTTLPFGILLASVAFALLHFASWVYFAVTLAAGLILGVVYWASGSLLLVMVWHGIYDLLAIIALARYPHLLGLAAK